MMNNLFGITKGNGNAGLRFGTPVRLDRRIPKSIDSTSATRPAPGTTR